MVPSVETVGPLDRQRMGLSVEHPEVETQELDSCWRFLVPGGYATLPAIAATQL